LPHQSAQARSRFRLNARNLWLTWPQCNTSKEEALEALVKEFPDNKGIVVAHELHEDGSPHLHAVVRLYDKTNYRSAHCLDHITGKHGNYQAQHAPYGNLKYCLKDGDYAHTNNWDPALELERLKNTSEGKLHHTALMIKEGKTIKDVDAVYPEIVFMYPAKIAAYKAFQLGARTWGAIVTIIMGPPDAGKSTWARDRLIDLPGGYYEHHSDNKWWPEYSGQENVLIDDYEGQIPRCEFLALIDTTPSATYVEYKQTHIPFRGHNIMITSNFGLSAWYKREVDARAIVRRVYRWVYFPYPKQWDNYHEFFNYDEFRRVAQGYT